MKKTCSLALALTLCMGLAVPAHAAGETKTIEVTIRSLSHTLTITNVLRVEEADAHVHLDEDGNYSSYAFDREKIEKRTLYVIGDEGATVTATGVTPDIWDVRIWDVTENGEIYMRGYVPYLGEGASEGRPYEDHILEYEDASVPNPDAMYPLYATGAAAYEGYNYGGRPVVYSLLSYPIDIEEGKEALVIHESAYKRFISAAPAPQTSTTPAPQTSTTPAPQASTTPAPQTSTAPAPAPAGPGVYTVKKGDTLGRVSVNYYGSYAYSKAIYQANAAAFKASKGAMTPGMTLTLPDTIGKAVRLAPATAGAGESLYTVKAGDTLGKIAQAAYGSASRYKDIFERNADRLKNANTIYEGQVIVLPAK